MNKDYDYKMNALQSLITSMGYISTTQLEYICKYGFGFREGFTKACIANLARLYCADEEQLNIGIFIPASNTESISRNHLLSFWLVMNELIFAPYTKLQESNADIDTIGAFEKDVATKLMSVMQPYNGFEDYRFFTNGRCYNISTLNRENVKNTLGIMKSKLEKDEESGKTDHFMLIFDGMTKAEITKALSGFSLDISMNIYAAKGNVFESPEITLLDLNEG